MADTLGNESGLSLDQAASAFAGILSGPADKQEESEAHPPSHEGGETASEYAEPETAEHDAEAQSDDDDSADDSEQPNETPRYRVKVDGQEVEVELDELLKGYQRREDYSRKTAEAAEQRKAAEAEAQRIAQERQHYAQTLAAAQQMLSQYIPQEPDWEQAFNQDPIEAMRQKARWDAHKEKLGQIQAEQHRVAQIQMQEAVQAEQRFLQSEFEKIAEWKDPEVAKTEKVKLREYLKAKGAPDEAINSVRHAFEVDILRDAMRYRELMAKKPAIESKTPPAPKSITPGSAQTGKRVVSELTRQKERLAKTGRVEDAAAIFKSLLS